MFVSLHPFSRVNTMLQNVAKQTARWTTRVSFLLALLVVGAAQRVEAGCSHFVTSQAGRESLESLTGLRVLQVDTQELEASQFSIPEGQLPCRGPGCSRKEGLPTVPIAVSMLDFERWCVIDDAPMARNCCSTRLMTDSPRVKTCRVSSSIERPPRSS